jgi:hypothetical protein
MKEKVGEERVGGGRQRRFWGEGVFACLFVNMVYRVTRLAPSSGPVTVNYRQVKCRACQGQSGRGPEGDHTEGILWCIFATLHRLQQTISVYGK